MNLEFGDDLCGKDYERSPYEGCARWQGGKYSEAPIDAERIMHNVVAGNLVLGIHPGVVRPALYK